MKIEKSDIISILINISIYIIIISLLSINENIKDIIFVVGFATIMFSSLLSLFKINLKKFRYFIWINLIMFPLTYLYDTYTYDKENFINHLVIFLIIILFFGIKFLKNKPKIKT
ncbi:hypothetical protein [Flavobacterium channae]|uniref:hypothetical protein n=1 Tax=Flavobacterium channae TaxID=2897181 RepID=UPI001E3CBF93|nr:hypothetical protein [Flavobacterium channae]UGS24603.1 hypothetical protein LOS89_04840 [Flavobacterium channae]